MIPERIEAIRSALQGSVLPLSGLQWVLLLLAVAAAALACWIMRRQRVSGWRMARNVMAVLGATRREAAELRVLAERHCEVQPVELLRQIGAFEAAVDRRMRALCPRPGWEEPLESALLRCLRRRLEFDRPSGVRFYSSRELPTGTELEVVVDPDTERRTIRLRAQVGRTREDALLARQMQWISEGYQGRPARVYFLLGTRRYSFDSRVLDVNVARRSCLLAHTLDVRRDDQRRSRRVVLNRPVACRRPQEPAAYAREVLLLDLNAHGTALVSPCMFRQGESILLCLEPRRLLHEPPEARALEVRGTVVSVDAGPEGQAICRVEFEDLQTALRDRLFALVGSIEREGRRAE